MATRFAGLNRAQLSYNYLHTNSTTHEFLFGAIVEMVDNSKDAEASTCAIWTLNRPHLRGGRILCFLDDGCGMSPEEAVSVMTFGYSNKRRDPSMIGQYGNGLKSGAMRIGKDLIVFTKKDDVVTCIFLSRTFHDEEGIDEIIVPTPSFTADGAAISDDIAKHELELEVILRHSPFHSIEDLREQFNLLKNNSGTLVMMYNLKLNEDGQTELDFDSDSYDIRLFDPDGGDKTLVPEQTSLRAYLSVIYSYPHMKIYLNGKKVRTRSVIAGLYKPRQYKFSSTKFKMRAEQQIKELKETLGIVQERKKEAEMKLKEFEKKHPNMTNKEIRAQWRKLQDDVQEGKNEIERLKDSTNAKIKLLKDPKTLTFMFGLNVENRSHDGCFIYNNGRLIKMYEKAGPQVDGGVRGSGVVGVVDVPFTVMEPTHNKQDFADSREYRQAKALCYFLASYVMRGLRDIHPRYPQMWKVSFQPKLLRSMGDHLDQYWNDLNLAKEGVLQFWQQFGYSNGMGEWNLSPLNEERYMKKRMMSVNVTLQCDVCLKWRVLPFDSRYLKEGWPPDKWTCSNNPDTANNKCQFAEKQIQIPTGKLHKEGPTVEQKREQLEKKIEKQKAEVEKLSGLSTVRSRRDMNEAERKRKEQEVVVARTTKRAPQSPRSSATSSTRNHAAKTAARKRAPTPPSPPPQKKPRTKAELRKQMQSQRRAVASTSEDNSDEEDVQFEGVETAPVANTPTPTPASPTKRNARKSIAVSKRVEEATSTTPATKKLIVQKEEAHSTAAADGDVRSVVSPDHSVEESIPSSSGAECIPSTERKDTPVPATSTETADELVLQKLRRLFYYFVPPNYKHTKAEIGNMSKERLMAIDLPEFFQAYESGLKKLVSEHQRSTEKAYNELRQLRHSCVEFAESQGVQLVEDGNADSVDRELKAYLERTRST